MKQPPKSIFKLNFNLVVRNGKGVGAVEPKPEPNFRKRGEFTVKPTIATKCFFSKHDPEPEILKTNCRSASTKMDPQDWPVVEVLLWAGEPFQPVGELQCRGAGRVSHQLRPELINGRK